MEIVVAVFENSELLLVFLDDSLELDSFLLKLLFLLC